MPKNHRPDKPAASSRSPRRILLLLGTPEPLPPGPLPNFYRYFSGFSGFSGFFGHPGRPGADINPPHPTPPRARNNRPRTPPIPHPAPVPPGRAVRCKSSPGPETPPRTFPAAGRSPPPGTVPPTRRPPARSPSPERRARAAGFPLPSLVHLVPGPGLWYPDDHLSPGMPGDNVSDCLGCFG